MLRVLGRAVRREPLFRRGHRHRRAQGERPVAAGAELGAVPGLGKRPLPRSVAALFFGEPVLDSMSFRGDANGSALSRRPMTGSAANPESRDSGSGASAPPRNDGYTASLPRSGESTS